MIAPTHTPPPVQATLHDITEMARTWGFEDAVEGMDQRGSQFFLIGSAAWDSYEEGFAEGASMFYSLTGIKRPICNMYGEIYEPEVIFIPA